MELKIENEDCKIVGFGSDGTLVNYSVLNSIDEHVELSHVDACFADDVFLEMEMNTDLGAIHRSPSGKYFKTNHFENHGDWRHFDNYTDAVDYHNGE
jgi:hypothetical protein